MKKTYKLRVQAQEEKAFAFRPLIPTKPCTFTLTPSGGYLNVSAAKELARAGKYVEILVDPTRQALKFSLQHTSGRGRYKIFKQSGASLQIRNKLAIVGMKNGIYLKIDDFMFQNIDYIQNEMY